MVKVDLLIRLSEPALVHYDQPTVGQGYSKRGKQMNEMKQAAWNTFHGCMVLVSV